MITRYRTFIAATGLLWLFTFSRLGHAKAQFIQVDCVAGFSVCAVSCDAKPYAQIYLSDSFLGEQKTDDVLFGRNSAQFFPEHVDTPVLRVSKKLFGWQASDTANSFLNYDGTAQFSVQKSERSKGAYGVLMVVRDEKGPPQQSYRQIRLWTVEDDYSLGALLTGRVSDADMPSNFFGAKAVGSLSEELPEKNDICIYQTPGANGSTELSFDYTDEVGDMFSIELAAVFALMSVRL